ncbi:MAG: SDR family oxidoreductase, partial [Bryobacterales bacterium]|nr:SDR family oxidoreductase [Bryobacterales bacterium]
MELHDRVALVTGASQGIGAALAGQLRKAGCRVVRCARNEDALRALAGPDELVVAGDLLDGRFREHLMRSILERFGRLDILVNNAGVGHYRNSIEADSDEIRALWELNFFVPLELARLAVPRMLAQPRLPDAREQGMVVNVSSIAGKVTLPWFTMYSASKFALCSWTEGLRMEYLGRGIRSLAVCPGYVKTSFQANVLSGAPPDPLAQS